MEKQMGGKETKHKAVSNYSEPQAWDVPGNMKFIHQL